jgi:hypothetical protein
MAMPPKREATNLLLEIAQNQAVPDLVANAEILERVVATEVASSRIATTAGVGHKAALGTTNLEIAVTVPGTSVTDRKASEAINREISEVIDQEVSEAINRISGVTDPEVSEAIDQEISEAINREISVKSGLVEKTTSASAKIDLATRKR